MIHRHKWVKFIGYRGIQLRMCAKCHKIQQEIHQLLLDRHVWRKYL